MRLLFALCALLLIASPAGAETLPEKRIALTFDDVPRTVGPFLTPDQRTRMLIAALRRARVRQAAFFVNPCHIGSGAGVNGVAHIRAYVRAGHVIGNHTCTHPRLSDTSAVDYISNIEEADTWLRHQRGFRPWFRYPYLDEGSSDAGKRDAVRAALADRGLRDAYVTAESADWNMEADTIAAVKAGKPIDRAALRDLYIESHVQAADFYDDLMQRAVGRRTAQVMLLHETDLAALYIGDLVKALRRDGWTIITADEAYADPIAHEAATYQTPSALGTLTEMLAWEKGLPKPRWYDRNDVTLANRLFDERVLKETPPQ